MMAKQEQEFAIKETSLQAITEKYAKFDASSESVDEYLKKGNNPQGSYVGVISVFAHQGESGNKYDKMFYRWLIEKWKKK